MAAPKRELFKPADVCEMVRLQPYVLRSWESEFPGLGQLTNGGTRMYRREDVELVLRIKQLVFVDGLTLAGARRRLEEEAEEPSAAAAAVDDFLGAMARSRLQQVRSGLEAILALLDRNVATPELELVPPPAGPAPATRRSRATSRDGAPARRTAKA